LAYNQLRLEITRLSLMTDTFSLHQLFSELEARGFVYQTTDREALQARLSQGPLTLYLGADVTAPSFHVGNLLVLMTVRWFQRAGHQVILLLGGGTTQVGDPSDKKSARTVMEKGTIEANWASLHRFSERFFSAADGPPVRVVNNKDWLESLGYMDFLGRIGRHFSVNRMVSFEFVRNRLENQLPLSFLELNYMLLQAYDFLHLFETQGCILQVGGADQWANILNGVELIRKMHGAEAFALTVPLLTTSSGAKMGKTAQGAVWLNPDALAPYDFWQFWRTVEDQDVSRFLNLFTFLPREEINALTQVSGAALNAAKKRLADEVTTLVHGAEVLPQIHQTVETFFGRALAAATDQILEIAPGLTLLDCLQEAGWFTSKSEARRGIRGGGVRLNDTPVADETLVLGPDLWTHGERLKLSWGTKKHLWLMQKGIQE